MFAHIAYADDGAIATSGLAYVQAVQDALLAFVAAALFVSCCVLLFQRFTSVTREDGGYAVKRIAGMLAVVFIIVLLSKAGVTLAESFEDISPTEADNNMAVQITHHGEHDGDSQWYDGTTKDFGDLLDWFTDGNGTDSGGE